MSFPQKKKTASNWRNTNRHPSCHGHYPTCGQAKKPDIAKPTCNTPHPQGIQITLTELDVRSIEKNLDYYYKRPKEEAGNVQDED